MGTGSLALTYQKPAAVCNTQGKSGFDKPVFLSAIRSA